MATLTYRTHVESTANQTNYTFNSIDVGTDPDTLVIVACHGSGGSGVTLSSITIGGTAGAVDVSLAASGVNASAGIGSREFTPGGTISIVVGWSAGHGRCSIGVWTLTGHASATKHAVGSSNSGGEVSPEIPAGGFGVYAATDNATGAMTWTTATERYDVEVESAAQHSGADHTVVSTSSPAVSATSDAVIVGATWAPLAGTAFSLVSAVGAFTLTGIAVALKVNRPLAAAVGEFILTGIAATLTASLKIAAAVGTFTLTGIAVALKVNRPLAAAVGEFILTGIAVTFNAGITLISEVGAFVLTGIDAAFKLGVSIAANVGTFIFTGQAVNLLRPGINLVAAVGTFTLNGIAVVLSYVQAGASGLARFALRRRVKPKLNDRRTSAPSLHRLRRGR